GTTEAQRTQRRPKRQNQEVRTMLPGITLSSVFFVPLWFPVFAANEPSFPRGPGFYFDLLKLIPVVIVYLLWVRTCWWVDTDAKKHKLARLSWNPILLGCGLLGLLIVWLLPLFWLSFLGLLALYVAPALIYVNQRNQEVSEEDKVLTKRHLWLLAEH